jgi:hypothetical protein
MHWRHNYESTKHEIYTRNKYLILNPAKTSTKLPTRKGIGKDLELKFKAPKNIPEEHTPVSTALFWSE